MVIGLPATVTVVISDEAMVIGLPATVTVVILDEAMVIGLPATVTVVISDEAMAQLFPTNMTSELSGFSPRPLCTIQSLTAAEHFSRVSPVFIFANHCEDAYPLRRCMLQRAE